MSDIRFNRWLHQSGTGGVYQDSTGSVGIGTSVPTSLVDIQGGNLKIGNHTLSSSSSSLNINGNVSIAGTLTYEDVTNIDSVGIITAQSGLHVTGGSVGIGTDNPSSRLQILDIDGTTTITGSRGSGHSYKLETTGSNAEGFNIIDVDNAQRAWLYYAGANPATNSYHTFNTNGTEKLRINHDGTTYIGEDYSVPNAVARFNVQNEARIGTTSGTYIAGGGGIVDYARYEMISNCVTSFPANNNKIMARNGAPVLINDTRDTWSHYTSLPNYLLGSLTHDCINNSSFTVTLACTMTVFLLRDNGWNPVDLSGWNLIESGGSIGISAISNGRLYVTTLGAGSHALNNNSAMYFFMI